MLTTFFFAGFQEFFCWGI